jgi:RNA polymerase sigma-70 factor, ECF subfamily
MPDNSPSEKARFDSLLRAARRGDRDALGQLFNPLRRLLRCRAEKRMTAGLQAKEWPSDLVQNTYLAALRAFPAFRGTTEPELYAWLKAILERELFNCQRFYHEPRREMARERPEYQRSDVDLLAGSLAMSQCPITDLIAAERSQRVHMAVQNLPDLYRQVVDLHAWGNMSFEAIGRKLGHSPEAVRKYWLRARQHLAATLTSDR